MRINATLLGLATAVSAGISYVLCALAVAVAPAATSRAFGFVMHMDLSSIARPLTWGSFIIGLVAFSAVIGLLVWFAAIVYAALAGERLRVPEGRASERMTAAAGR